MSVERYGMEKERRVEKDSHTLMKRRGKKERMSERERVNGDRGERVGERKRVRKTYRKFDEKQHTWRYSNYKRDRK